jgi:TonB-linked SusC/RagA family outer membrane protein
MRTHRLFYYLTRHILLVLFFYPLLTFPRELLAAFPGGPSPAIQITGKITDNNGEALPGVTVVVKGTSSGTTTGVDGSFNLTVPEGQETGTLVISFVGYVTQELPILGRTVFNVSLAPDVKALQEVVVIGYQTVRKQDLTGAVSVVNADEARRVTANTVAESLQGLTAGVTVRNSGAPGVGAKIDIRGTGTFGRNEPLYVIDGMLSTATPDFNPNDIESIQVLKDASAAAIYGSRAANGVIIITTKRGQEGPLRVAASVKAGIQQFHRRLDLMDNQAFAALNRLAYQNAGLTPQTSVTTEFDPNINTDWQDAIMRTGSIQDYNLALSGGSQTATFLISGNYFGNKGTIIDNGFERGSLRLNTTAERGRFKFGEFLLLSHTHTDSLEGNPFLDMVYMLPTMPLQGSRYVNATNPEGWAFGDAVYAQTFGTNIYGLQKAAQRDQYNSKIRGNAFVELELLQGLSYKFNAGLETSFDHFKGFSRPGQFRRGNPPVIATLNESRGQFLSLLFEHTVNFAREFGSHNFSAVAGVSNQTFRFDQTIGQKLNLPMQGNGEYLRVLNQGNNPSVGGNTTKWAILGYLGRVNYSFADRYLVSATIRRDGDSRFGPDHRWGTFPSISAGWRLSEEAFFAPLAWVSDLKVRASYGTLGNSEVLKPWQYFGRISPLPRTVFGPDEAVNSGAINITLANRDIRWETKKTTNFGLDAALLDNQLSFTVEYFIAKTEDVLTNLPIALTTGNALGNPPVNAASIQNKGVEFMTTFRNRNTALKWDVSLNLSRIRNEVTALGNLGAGRNYIQLGDARTEIGRAIGEWYVLKTAGIFQNQAEIDAHRVQPWAKPGDIRYVDADGNGSLDVNLDRTYAGSPWPKLEGGLIWNASYQQFTCSMQWIGVAGTKLYNRPRYITDRFSENANYRQGISPWTPENTGTDVPRIALDNGGVDQGIVFNARPNTDRWLEKGDYLRLRNLQIGFSLPASLADRMGLTTTSIYISGQNLLTFTEYTGLDPDITGVNIFERGLDAGQYPALRMFSVGVQFGL